ncbi:F-box associated domain containing protein [Tanacetum coccineum]
MEDLPLNAMVDILSRLPVKTIIHCKCVCKKWHFLVSESYFVKLHLSRSPVGLIIHHFTMQEMHNNGLGTLKLVEIEDEVDHHRLYHDPIMNFDLNRDGHVHWIVRDENCPEKICAFNFDNETFKLFPSPPFDAAKEHSISLRSMGVLNGCLSQCDSTYNDVTIWVMNEYGIKNSWYKMANVRQYMCPKLLMFQPINLLHGLKDGGVLMVHYQEKLYAYYPGTNAIEDIRMFNGHFTGVTYRPSFVKLRDFEVESERVRLLKV